MAMTKQECSAGMSVRAKIGDTLFHGTVTACHPKRAVVEIENREAWRIPYSLLSRSDQTEFSNKRWDSICPIGSTVAFCPENDLRIVGHVIELTAEAARIRSTDAAWTVAYNRLEVLESPQISWPLSEVLERGRQLLRRHDLNDWWFGFDFSRSRAGVCHHSDKKILLSVSFCHKASRGEIEDTILHEIAHALVGPGHNHNDVWQAKANEIGCSAQRCHTVTHTPSRWFGTCPCGNQWTRQKLTRRTREGICIRCNGKISWRRSDGSIKGFVDSRATDRSSS